MRNKLSVSSAWLEIFSLSFLVFPYFIFIVGWLKPIIALPLIIVVGLSIYFLIKIIWTRKKMSFSVDSRQLFIGLIIVIVWTLLSGAGHKSINTGDAQKHNAVLLGLVDSQWPPAFMTNSHLKVYLVYYIAYYLPAAAIGKLLGWIAANIFLFIWTLIGTGLSIVWFVRNTKGSFVKGVLFFILFSGLDIVGQLIMFSHTRVLHPLEWWADIWQYSSNTTLLYYVPQHALAGWITTGILYFYYDEKVSLKNILFYIALTLLWSPFITIGLLPLYIVLYWRSKNKEIFYWQNFSALVIGGLMVVFFLSNGFITSKPTQISGWLWQVQNIYAVWDKLLLFYILEVGCYAALIFYYCHRSKKRIDSIFSMAVICLLLLPFYRLGVFNDLVMRASIPALMIIAIYVAKVMNEKQKSTKYFIFIGIVVIAIANYNPLTEFYRSIVIFHLYSPKQTLGEIGKELASQYFGSEKSFFFRYLTKKTVVNQIRIQMK